MAESPVGAPGGAGAGPRSATAATFQVDDSSLRSLRKTWQGLTQDVKAFNTELLNLRKGDQTLASIQAKLSALGVGSPGGRGGGGGTVTPASFSTTGPVAGSVHSLGMPTVGPPVGHQDNMGAGRQAATTQSTFTDTGGGGGLSTRQKIAGGVLAGGAAVGGYYGSRMGGITTGDTFYVDQARAGGPFSGQSRQGVYNFMMGGNGQRGMNNFAGSEDLFQGGNMLQQGQGGSLAGPNSQATRDLFRSASRMAGLNPAGGATSSASALTNLYSTRVDNALTGAGVGGGSLAAGGRRRDAGEIYRDLLKKVFRGQTPTSEQLAAGGREGSRMRYSLDHLGLNADAQDQVVRFGQVQAALGGSYERAQAALTANDAGKSNRDTKLAGLQNSIQYSQNKKGQASARNEQAAGQQGREGIKTGFETLATATDGLTAAFTRLNKGIGGIGGGVSGTLLGGAGVLGGPLAGAVGALGGPMGIGFGLQSMKSLMGGTTLRGALKGGAGAALGASGAMGTPVYVTNMPGGGFGGGGGDPLGGKPPAGSPPGGGPVPVGRFARLRALAGRGVAAAGLGLRFLGGNVAGGTGAAVVGGAVIAGALAGTAAIAAGFQQGAQNDLNAGMVARGSGQGSKHRGTHWWDIRKYDTFKEQAGHNLFGHIPGLGGLVDRGTGYKYDKLAADHVHGKHADMMKNCPLCDKGVPNGQSRLPGDSASVSSSTTAPTPAMSSPYANGEQGDGPGGAGRGPATIDTIESMAKRGPSDLRVTSTYRPDARTSSGNLSYHATHNAVDFAGDKPGVDTPQLLAINKFFAGKYGKGLKELIYAGPGGINLLNGAPFIYDADTRAQHHNHVHVAATQESLKKVGGVADSSAAPGTPGATSDSGGVATSPGGAQAAGMDQTQADILSGANTALFAAIAGTGGRGSGSNGQGANTSAGGAVPAPTGSNVADVWRNLIAQGWTPAQAAGIMGNIQSESGFNPYALQGGGNSMNPAAAGNGGYGLVQWTPGSKLIPLLHGAKPSISSEIKAMTEQLTSGSEQSAGAALRAQTDPGRAADVFGLQYERYAGPPQGARHAQAQAIYKKYGPAGHYEKGAYDVAREHMAVIHSSEMVLDANTANKVRSSLRDRSSSEPSLAQSVAAALSSNGGGSGASIQINAPITMVGTATEKDARDFLSKVKRIADRDQTLSLIGKGH